MFLATTLLLTTTKMPPNGPKKKKKNNGLAAPQSPRLKPTPPLEGFGLFKFDGLGGGLGQSGGEEDLEDFEAMLSLLEERGSGEPVDSVERVLECVRCVFVFFLKISTRSLQLPVRWVLESFLPNHKKPISWRVTFTAGTL